MIVNLRTYKIVGSTVCVLIALSILLVLIFYSYFNLDKVGYAIYSPLQLLSYYQVTKQEMSIIICF